MRSFRTLAAAALAVPVVASAQGPSASDDSALRRIWAIGMDSSHLPRLAQAMLDSIGPRLTGSPEMLRASDFVISKYRDWGIEGRREQYGTWRGWRRGISHVDLVEPRVRSLEAMMLAWSPGTGNRPVTAPVIVLPKFENRAAFERWLPEARGKLVLLSPAWPTCRPSQDWFQFGTPASRLRMDTLVAQTMQEWGTDQDPDKRFRGTGYPAPGSNTGALGLRLDSAGVAGIITHRSKLGYPNPFQTGRAGGAGGGGRAGGAAPQGSNGQGVMELFQTANTRAPAIGMGCEDYGLIYRLAENGQKPVVRMTLDAELLGEVPAFNTFGTIKGTAKPDEYVMLSAHFDSWDGGSGATDNGTGTLMMMEAMRILKQVLPRPRRTIMVGHWNSEEQGLNGSRAFAQDHPEVLRGLQALFNQDNGTGRVQSVSTQGLPGAGARGADWFRRLPAFYTDSASPNFVRFNFQNTAPGNPGGTDGAVFTCYGTPSFGMGAVSWNYSNYTWHTTKDTYDKVVFDDLKHNATLVAMLAYLASEEPELISRDRSPGTFPASCGLAPRQTPR